MLYINVISINHFTSIRTMSGLTYKPIENDKYGQLLKKYFITTFRTGYLTVNDYVVPEYFKLFGDRIQNLEVDDTDVFVCSFPKTGTTWTQEMVWCIANDLDYEGATEFLGSRFPFLEHSPLFDYREVLTKYPDWKPPSYVLDSVTYIDKELKRPRFVKTHLPWPLLPQQIQNGSKKPKIIYVTRNPKDTCVSYYHHCRLLEGYQGTFEEFVNLFTHERLCFAPFWKHIEQFWNRRNNENILFIHYEDMKRDLRSIVNKVASFLNKSLTEDQMIKLLDHLSFQSMKQNRAVNYEEVVEINKQFNLIDANGSFMRSGEVGGYKALMTPEMIQQIDDWSERHVKMIPEYQIPE